MGLDGLGLSMIGQMITSSSCSTSSSSVKAVLLYDFENSLKDYGSAGYDLVASVPPVNYVRCFNRCGLGNGSLAYKSASIVKVFPRSNNFVVSMWILSAFSEPCSVDVFELPYVYITRVCQTEPRFDGVIAVVNTTEESGDVEIESKVDFCKGWVHVAVVCNYAFVYLYVNGELVDSSSVGKLRKNVASNQEIRVSSPKGNLGGIDKVELYTDTDFPSQERCKEFVMSLGGFSLVAPLSSTSSSSTSCSSSSSLSSSCSLSSSSFSSSSCSSSSSFFESGVNVLGVSNFSYNVIGAGLRAVNGGYEEHGVYNDHPSYINHNGYHLFFGDLAWTIAVENGQAPIYCMVRVGEFPNSEPWMTMFGSSSPPSLLEL